jgi:hypothetical protein
VPLARVSNSAKALCPACGNGISPAFTAALARPDPLWAVAMHPFFARCMFKHSTASVRAILRALHKIGKLARLEKLTEDF